MCYQQGRRFFFFLVSSSLVCKKRIQKDTMNYSPLRCCLIFSLQWYKAVNSAIYAAWLTYLTFGRGRRGSSQAWCPWPPNRRLHLCQPHGRCAEQYEGWESEHIWVDFGAYEGVRGRPASYAHVLLKDAATRQGSTCSPFEFDRSMFILTTCNLGMCFSLFPAFKLNVCA